MFEEAGGEADEGVGGLLEHGVAYIKSWSFLHMSRLGN